MNVPLTQKHFLVVDNGSQLLPLILRRLTEAGHRYTHEVYDPHMPLTDEGYDAIILSGGMIHEVTDKLPNGSYWFEQEFELIRNTNKPLFGICLGLQMITVALGGELDVLPRMISGTQTLEFDDDVAEIFGQDRLNVYQKHQWVAADIPSSLEVLVESDIGIEMIQHRSRPILATQFHPEVSTAQFKACCAGLFDLETATLYHASLRDQPLSRLAIQIAN